MSILDTILNKGGAGTTISRHETVEALNPLIEQHHRLNHAYRQAAATFAGTALAQSINEALRTARMDVGKLSETVLSAGGVPFNGTSIEPDESPLPEGQAGLEELAAQERGLLDAVARELDGDHHIRTEAILGNVRAHGEERLNLITRAAQKPLR